MVSLRWACSEAWSRRSSSSNSALMLRVPRVSVEQWLKDDLPERMNRFFEVITITKEALEQRTPNTPDFNRKLADFIEFIEYLSIEFPRLYLEWCNRNTQNKNN